MSPKEPRAINRCLTDATVRHWVTPMPNRTSIATLTRRLSAAEKAAKKIVKCQQSSVFAEKERKNEVVEMSYQKSRQTVRLHSMVRSRLPLRVHVCSVEANISSERWPSATFSLFLLYSEEIVVQDGCRKVLLLFSHQTSCCNDLF